MRAREREKARNPLSQLLGPRGTLILGAVSLVGVMAVLLATKLGLGSVLALAGVVGVAGLTAWGLSSASRARAARELAQWEANDAKLVREEKVEQLGHTLGGLSTAAPAQDGQLAEVEPLPDADTLSRLRERPAASNEAQQPQSETDP